MVVENIFKEKWVEGRPICSLLLGIIVTVLSFIVSFVLFRTSPGFIGISTVLFSVILAVYGVNNLFSLEKKHETKKHLGFFREHEEIIDFFVYFFIGMFMAFFVISLIGRDFVFSRAELYGESFSELKMNLPEGNFPPLPTTADVLGKQVTPAFLNYDIYDMFKNSLYVMVVSFLLSIFYNSGAIFLIALNASIFASALADVVRTRLVSGDIFFSSGFMLCNVSVMFFHMIPEAASYCIAAIAGGVLSKAFLKEKIFSHRFKMVLLDSFILMVVAIFVLFFAAIIEMKISAGLLSSDACISNSFFITLAAVGIIFFFALFELIRRKKLLKQKI
ncbi:hypothetical protein JXA85_08905 [Candidatus Woesearchaeota archaeon]|nr:hypothetical protein [Candidatus Woesearchaeota archaeon]